MANTAQDQTGITYISIPFPAETVAADVVNVDIVAPFSAYIENAHVVFNEAQAGHATNHRVPTLYTAPNGLEGSTADSSHNKIVQRAMTEASTPANTVYDLFEGVVSAGGSRAFKKGETIRVQLAAGGTGIALRSGVAVLSVTGYASRPVATKNGVAVP